MRIMDCVKDAGIKNVNPNENLDLEISATSYYRIQIDPCKRYHTVAQGPPKRVQHLLFNRLPNKSSLIIETWRYIVLACIGNADNNINTLA